MISLCFERFFYKLFILFFCNTLFAPPTMSRLFVSGIQIYCVREKAFHEK